MSAAAAWQPTDFQAEGQPANNARQPKKGAGGAWQPADFQEEKPAAAPPQSSAPVTSDQSNVGNILGEQWLSPEAQSEADTKLAPASGMLTSALLTGPMAGEAIEAGGLIPGALKVGRGVIGGTIGAGMGAGVGSQAGSVFGETGRTVGRTIGGIGGGLLGGGLAAELERQPATMKQALARQPGRIGSMPFGMQRFIPEWMVPGPSSEALASAGERAEQEQLGSFMNRGYKPVGASPSGGGVGASAAEESVATFPEPRPLFPGENPNYSASTPRDELEGLAQRAKPGAGTQLQQLGKPILYRPRGASETSFAPPRASMRWNPDMQGWEPAE